MQSVSCYILDSSKPVREDELKDCGMIIGMNALDSGLWILMERYLKSSNAIGVANTEAEKTSDLTDTGPAIKESMETPDSANQVNTVPEKATGSEDPMTVVLAQELQLGPQQTRVARVKLNGEEPNAEIGIVTPSESILTSKHCDFMEGYWTGESSFSIPVTNWGTENVVLNSAA